MDEKKLSEWEALAPDLVAEVRRLQEENRQILASKEVKLIVPPVPESEGKMTAREVAERHEEKLLQLGPVMERLQASEVISYLQKALEEANRESARLRDAHREVRRLSAVVAELKAEFGSITRNASRAERERCAKVAERPIPLEAWSSEKDLRRIIADAIRALPDEE